MVNLNARLHGFDLSVEPTVDEPPAWPFDPSGRVQRAGVALEGYPCIPPTEAERAALNEQAAILRAEIDELMAQIEQLEATMKGAAAHKVR